MQHQKNVAHLFTRVKTGHVKDTSHFHVSDDCIGCGACARICPADAIQMVENRPVWAKDSCYACFGCLRECPVEAITYGMYKRIREEGCSDREKRSPMLG